MPLPDPENHKFNVTLPKGYYEKLRIWAQSEQGYAASKAAYILQTAIDQAEAEGKIPTEDQPTIEDFNCLIGYIELLSGARKAKDFDFKYLAELTGFAEARLQDLYRRVSERRSNA